AGISHPSTSSATVSNSSPSLIICVKSYVRYGNSALSGAIWKYTRGWIDFKNGCNSLRKFFIAYFLLFIYQPQRPVFVLYSREVLPFNAPDIVNVLECCFPDDTLFRHPFCTKLLIHAIPSIMLDTDLQVTISLADPILG